jgi:hypothetical protein
MFSVVAISKLLQQFDVPGVRAVVLMGSYARGDAGPFSDIDLVRFVDQRAPQPAGTGSHLIDGHLVVVSNVLPTNVEDWFTEPEAAVETIAGVRSAQPLVDRDAYFATLQARAHAFMWDTAMQERANRWASTQMVGWSEEVHKGLEGLRRNDIGRMLLARHGCSWGLSRVMQVQRGVLLGGDNAFYDQVAQAVGPDSEWARLRRMVFGVANDQGAPPSLHEQVVAGLRLYAVTAQLLVGALQPQDEPLIVHTVALINQHVA